MTSYSVRRLSIFSLAAVVIASIGCNKTATPPPTTTAATPAASVDLPNVQVASVHLERDGIMAPAKYWIFVSLNNSGPGYAQAKASCSWVCINSDTVSPNNAQTDSPMFPQSSTSDLRTDLSSSMCSSNAHSVPVTCKVNITRPEKTEPSKMLSWQGSLTFPQ